MVIYQTVQDLKEKHIYLSKSRSVKSTETIRDSRNATNSRNPRTARFPRGVCFGQRINRVTGESSVGKNARENANGNATAQFGLTVLVNALPRWLIIG